MINHNDTSQLRIGWAGTDITPEKSVLIPGQLYFRVSEGIRDPLTATALVLDTGDDCVIFVSCDLVAIPDELGDAVRRNLRDMLDQDEGIDPFKVILHATHTHTGADIRLPSTISELPHHIRERFSVMGPEAYIEFAAGRIAQAIGEAWTSRTLGGISYGQSDAVIGRNRRWVNEEGHARMYGLTEAVQDRFRHIEGYEDHCIQILATYDLHDQLTGIVLNIPCPSQGEGNRHEISADWWHEAREALRQRYGADIHILPQCSAAGDLTSHLIYGKRAHERMLALKGRTAHQEIARRIVNAVDDALPHMAKGIERKVDLRHRVDEVPLTMNRLTEQHLAEAREEVADWQRKYEEEIQRLQEQPELFEQPRWYKPFSAAYLTRRWHARVIERYEQQQQGHPFTTQVHVIRISDMVFATHSFEYYVDYGIQIKVRSRAVQTFLVQLAGSGTYIPSPRSVTGGGYGSVPASNLIGPEGGQQLADHTVKAIRSLWE